MKVYISFHFIQNSFGGGSNFLRYLQKYLSKKGYLVEQVRMADVILVNSHHQVIYNLYLKFRFPNKLFIHRIDGKLSSHRHRVDWDDLVKIQNKYISNATIYQSNWSKHQWEKDLKQGTSIVIFNEADPDLFYNNSTRYLSGATNLIFVSWSENYNKGSEYLEWIIREKNNYKLNLKIIGNLKLSSSKNLNIPVTHQEMQKLYEQSDIFFFPAKDEACSNALIEAQACGLPVLALYSGGNPELILDSGETFSNVEEMISGLNKIIENYGNYRLAALNITKNRKSVQAYENFIKSIIVDDEPIKSSSRIKLIYALILVIRLKIRIKLPKLK